MSNVQVIYYAEYVTDAPDGGRHYCIFPRLGLMYSDPAVGRGWHSSSHPNLDDLRDHFSVRKFVILSPAESLAFHRDHPMPVRRSRSRNRRS